MNMPDIPPDLGKLVAAPAGSAIALLWLTVPWYRAIAMFAAGWALAVYVAPLLSAWLHVNESASGFFCGLFGMAVIDKCFVTWKQFDIGPLLLTWVRQFLSVKPENDK
jgi:hypothetical protein